MKTRLVVILWLSLLLAVSPVGAFASRPSPAQSPESRVTVIGVVADIPGWGVMGFPSLEVAREEAKNLTSLDPVCNSVPQVCEDRFEAVVYTVLYSDGSTEIL